MVYNTLKVKFKKLSDKAVTPSYAKSGDAAMDLTATSINIDINKKQITYGTSLAFEIPEGYFGMIAPRSSLSNKTLSLSNHLGIIDSGYRGEVMFKFNYYCDLSKLKIYEVGDRIGQIIIMPYPKIQLVEANSLSDTERGTGAYGSSGA